MIKKFLPHIIAVVVMLLVSGVYFWPHFQNKVIPMGDIVQVRAMNKEVADFYKETGEVSGWTNSLFGGMPTYQIYNPNKTNLLGYVNKIISVGTDFPVSAFILGLISFYIMMLLLGVNPWLALAGALFFGFSTNNLILLEAGHTSKLNAIMVSPLIISGMLLAFQKKYILGLSVFATGMGLNLYFKHPQMTYYLGMVMSFLVLIYLGFAIKKRELPDFGKSILALGVGLILAFGSSITDVWTTYEYGKQTMRGEPILAADKVDKSSSSGVDGLAWDYAMNWSNGYKDLLSSYIPRAVGGGSGEWLDKDSAFAKLNRTRSDIQAPLYWGALPFTSGPIYFGALAFFLFLFGALSYRSPIKWWLVSGVLLTMILSLGKNAEWFNKFLFEHLPFFNKFRTPNSVLSITVILIPILGILGIDNMIKSEDKSLFWKPAWISAAILGGLGIILAFMGPSIFDMTSPGDARYAQFGEAQYRQIMNALLDDRATELRSSALRSVFFILIGLGALWAYINKKISVVVMAIILGVLGLVDLLQISTRYVSHDDFVSRRKYEANFQPRAVDTKIMSDTDLYYRVHDITSDPFNNASPSYYHKTVGGYHPAKLQRYQDVIDKYISQNNMIVLNMLNTKYFILPNQNQGGEATFQVNPAALGNAWFVSNIQKVNTANEEFDGIADLDPAITALVHKEFESKLSNTKFDKNGSITLISYAPNRLEYKSNSASDQFAVFSEIWYGPNLGWEATIDGQPVDLIRANYLLRAMNIPAGEHTIVMEFKPTSIAVGNKINLASSLIIILLIGYLIFTEIRKKPTVA